MRAGNREQGIAMVAAILVVTLLTLTAATAVEVASNTILRTRRETAMFNARATAEAALDLFAARAAADPGFVEQAIANPNALRPGPWVKLDAFGGLVDCGDGEDGCFRTLLSAADVVAGDTERRVRAVAVDVVARHGCRAAGPCAQVRLQQRLRRAPFFDFVMHTDYELMDPALLPAGDAPGQGGWQRAHCEVDSSGSRMSVLARPDSCVVPAWFGSGGADASDDVAGPIHTNDDRIPHCGNPTFRGAVETTRSSGDPATATIDNTFASQERGAAGCGSAAKAERTPQLVGPDAVLRKSPAIRLPPAVDHLDRAASGGHGIRVPGPGESPVDRAEVTLDRSGRVSVARRGVDGIESCECDMPTPDSGVIFIDAALARVHGESPFGLTVATTGVAVIDGDLGRTSDAASSVSIGVIAQGQVRIAMADGRASAVGKRRLMGVGLVSLDHTIVVDRWDDPTVCAPECPVLEFTGAIVSRYRPVIGSFDAATGRPSGGYRKQLTYMPELAVHQPPYMLTDRQSAWRRVDAVESGAGTTGLNPP